MRQGVLPYEEPYYVGMNIFVFNLTSPGPSKARSNSNLQPTSKTLKIGTVND
jgi:hypothetical protein